MHCMHADIKVARVDDDDDNGGEREWRLERQWVNKQLATVHAGPFFASPVIDQSVERYDPLTRVLVRRHMHACNATTVSQLAS